jgi:hypothetical protein
MRALLISTAVLIFALAIPLAADPPPCGNADTHPTIDLSDVASIMSYVGQGAPVPPVMANADCDGRVGITINDAMTIGKYLLQVYMDTIFHCTPTQTYSLTQSTVDTLFIPYMLNIPDGIDSVSLPLVSNLGAQADAYYLPLLKSGLGSTPNFELSTVTRMPSFMGLGVFTVLDSAVLEAPDLQGKGLLVGRKTVFTLNYRRISPGIANVGPQPYDRSAILVPSVARGGDLVRPILLNTEIILPPETLKTTPASLAFSTMAGKVTADSFLVSFTSTSLPFSFNLSTSDPWILLRNLPAGPLTTPASIWVRADATTLPIGAYNGQINMIPVIPGKPTDPAFVSVSFDVTTPIVYPPGDFNCDGIADLADLSRFVSYLTGGGATIKDCNR